MTVLKVIGVLAGASLLALIGGGFYLAYKAKKGLKVEFPQKSGHQFYAASPTSTACDASYSAGLMYPKVEWRRRRL
jgi:hypothetical protein